MDSGRRKDVGNDLYRWAHTKVPGFESIASFVRLLIERRLLAFFALVAAVLLFFFWGYIKMLFVMAFFTALAAVSMFYNRWLKVSLGVEFIMLGLVMASVAYGRLPGLIVGMLGLFLAEVLSERFTYSTFVSFIGIAVVGIITPNIYHQWTAGNLVTTGIIATVIYDAIIIPGYLLLGSDLGRSVLFFVTHIIFNVWVFTFIAPVLHKALFL